MEYSIMFNVLEGGVIESIKWDKNNLKQDRSIIILDESSLSVYLWHGIKQGLVARRTALRQADSLKGHGYSYGNSIIGMDIKTVKEIDHRKVGRDPETDILYEELEEILAKEFKVIEDNIVSFQIEDAEAAKEELKKGFRPKPPPEPETLSEPVREQVLTEIPEEKEEQQTIPTQKLRKEPERIIKPKFDAEPTVLKVETIEDTRFEKLITRLEGIESKLDILMTEFMEFKTSLKAQEEPNFIKNVRTMKAIIQESKSSSEAPVYPTRNEMIKKKADLKKE